MAFTDPIGDMLSRIRNAILARKMVVQIPASKVKLRIAEILKSEGYINGLARDDDTRQGLITLQLKWEGQQRPAIAGLKRVSRPGRRCYVGRGKIPRVQSGLGVAILTTSKGVMTDVQARKAKVGGEYMCEVW